MKKYLFSLLFLLGLTLSAMAQQGGFDWYDAYSDKEHKHYTTHYMINRKAMEFHFDWDSDNEMLMKNYKKNGNTESFDVYYKDRPSQIHASIVLVIDAANPANSKITYTVKEFQAEAQVQYLVLDNSKLPGSYRGDSPGAVGAASPGSSVKDGAKNLLNKGKNLFKKKK